MKTTFTLMFAVSAMVLAAVGCGGSADSIPNQKAIDALSNLDSTTTASGDSDTETGENEAPAAQEVATFGNGCYWCTEAVFQELAGVHEVVSGFSGGEREDVTYREVCDGDTGHAEVVKITFDPSVISFGELLEAFFLTHDPTTLNKQGVDEGPQYRSAIFYHSQKQKELAEKAIDELTKAGAFADPIVTEVTAWKNFVVAPKHQDYFDKNPNDRYCLRNIPDKIAKIRKVFKDKLKSH
jgi:peptide-methionine (S)-S-oxide reductase